MLSFFRQHSRFFAAPVFVIFMAGWLGLVALPCVAHTAAPELSQGLTQPVQHIESMPDCSHCSAAKEPCAEQLSPDCNNPQAAIVAAQNDTSHSFSCLLSVLATVPWPAPSTTTHIALPPAVVPPPDSPVTERFCIYNE